mmetsp:Transcript_13389/g.41332  ORF Transcript_13389/g.41332 Transcript_13389/m.41332 type:complete len:634 (-) Transcript_13389:17-1918(-)
MKDTTSMPPPQEFIANERRLSPSAPPTPREYAEAALVYGRDEDPGSVFPQVHASRAKTPKREVKLKESKDLRAFSSALKALLRDPSADVPSKEARDFVKIREVLKSHRLSADGDDDDASLDSLNVALFSGCKLQLKPVAWNQEGAAEAVQVVLKWGGVLTELGAEHAAALGAHFRQSIYPESEDGHGLLRLHATFRHDLKIRTSDEGRVMKTGAAFTKGLLELEGEIAPLLVSLIHRGRSDVHMLDRAGNHEAQALLDAAKDHVRRAFNKDVDLAGDASDDESANTSISEHAARRRLIAPDGPAAVLRALRCIKNPKKALDELWALVDALVESVADIDEDEGPALYMGETFRVWADSWRSMRKEFRKDDGYDLSKIPEICDKLRYDERHNAARLGLGEARCPEFSTLVERARALSRAVTPLEFGGAAAPRREAAWHVSRALLDKIALDLRTARGADGDASAGLSYRLDDDPRHLADSEIKSSWRAVRSRLYFTSESHLVSLLDALRLDEAARRSPVDAGGKAWLGDVPELSYLSHVVFRLWENPMYAADAPQRYVVDVALSPGTPFAARGADAGPPTAPLQVFAQIPSETLEAFFDSEGKADAAPGSVERAEATYAALAERLAKCANAPGGGV